MIWDMIIKLSFMYGKSAAAAAAALPPRPPDYKGDTTRIKKKFPPIAIINVLTQKQADNSFVVHI